MASTTGIDSWAVDLAEVGPIYPFQGTETVLMLIGFGVWIAWHVLQFAAEKRQLSKKLREHGSQDTVAKVVDDRGH